MALGSQRAGGGFYAHRAPAPFARYYGTWGSGAAWYSAWHSCPHNSRATGSPVEAISRGYFCAGQQETPEQPLEVPSYHRGGSRGRPRRHRSAPRTLDEALRLPGRLRARENGVYWRREGRDRGQKGAAHCGPVPGVDPRGGSTAQGRTPALRKAARWMIERARTGLCRSRKGHYGTEIGPV